MGCGFSCAPFFLSEAICAVFCPCCFLLADSEVFPHIDFNPSSAADVTALLTYIASQTGQIGVEAVAARSGGFPSERDSVAAVGLDRSGVHPPWFPDRGGSEVFPPRCGRARCRTALVLVRSVRRKAIRYSEEIEIPRFHAVDFTLRYSSWVRSIEMMEFFFSGSVSLRSPL
jgi:hypothetical protein